MTRGTHGTIMVSVLCIKQSGFEPWPGSLCSLSPARCINAGVEIPLVAKCYRNWRHVLA